MQGLVIPPRETLTDTQVYDIIRDSESLRVGAGAELLDLSLNVLTDITDDFKGGEVSRESYANLHGRTTLHVARELPWGNAILRPYMMLYSGSLSARFNLGAYFTNTPSRALGSRPIVYNVEGYDLLHALAISTGDAYAVNTGDKYLDAVEDILQSQGFTKYIIDPSRRTTTLPKSRVWPLEDNTTWLTVINDLLSAIGYRGIWSDWDGYLRCEPYETPTNRAVEWTYDVTLNTSMLYPERTLTEDYFNAPNSWIAVRSNNVDGPQPVEGDGIYRYTNQYIGKTSVEARGRVIPRKLEFEAADHVALVAQAQAAIDDDMRIKVTVDGSTSPNPLHWHFDVIELDDPELGTARRVLESSWTLPLDGSAMSHAWTVL